MNPERTFGRGGLNGFLDVDGLLEGIGLDEADVAWRKEFIGFDEADEQRLTDLEPMLRDNQDEIADEFYDNLLEYEKARDVVGRSPKGVEQLKQTQRAYLVSLATGDYDLEYFENRARIGKLHELLDMPLKQYVGQYGVYYDLIMRRVNERVQEQVVTAIEEWLAEREADADGGLGRLSEALGFGGRGGAEATDGLEASLEETVRDAIDDGMADVLSLLRIINLDVQIATETYVDSYAQDLEAAIEQREQLAADVESDVETPLDELHEAGEVVARRAEGISQHTESQAASAEEAATEIGEISAAAEEVASVAAEARRESERTEQLAADGVEAAAEARRELGAIEDATERVETAAAELESSTDEIDEAIERLDEMAQRTTILASNAKIESTRGDAGDETMAVIADEVNSFAKQTKRDLDAIETALEDISEATAETVDAVAETSDRVDQGGERVRDTIESLEEIHDAARSTAAGLADVAAATDQQAHSIEATAESVDDLSRSAEQVAEAAESVAAASQEQTASLGEVSAAVGRLTDVEPLESTPVYERVASESDPHLEPEATETQ
ncbi:globin-coupled sensor protein [Natronobacterium gregoryi]|uniref:Chemotaxis protein n=2 Tax=Natronobacterium gregoryi TaxID=44930 RepID=L0AHW0_NATGS|nr:globin-coupled sensor protein [Natronobacterium gregoryi]AFZ73498.1 methyl-accepting chemotaxis protein [Natronobacterium gregoryi SP2]ELY68351.1 chemotaxis sensory transducer [Natronobacterium gregoryi SP2]PLK20489.1 chemotaxis protein [Natronobacterium gregoryi SP2]SFI70589.1 Methyl-accepting chemotaxis protein [Natronobacterium gregoryi]